MLFYTLYTLIPRVLLCHMFCGHCILVFPTVLYATCFVFTIRSFYGVSVVIIIFSVACLHALSMPGTEQM